MALEVKVKHSINHLTLTPLAPPRGRSVPTCRGQSDDLLVLSVHRLKGPDVRHPGPWPGFLVRPGARKEHTCALERLKRRRFKLMGLYIWSHSFVWFLRLISGYRIYWILDELRQQLDNCLVPSCGRPHILLAVGSTWHIGNGTPNKS